MRYNKSRYTGEKITHLEDNEVFVFGSNLGGFHGGGAADLAFKKFGAIWGQAAGLQGQSQAIPTIVRGGIEEIRRYVEGFITFGQAHPELTFLVTRIGCGIAGYKDQEIAPLFSSAIPLPNVILPRSFVEALK